MHLVVAGGGLSAWPAPSCSLGALEGCLWGIRSKLEVRYLFGSLGSLRVCPTDGLREWAYSIGQISLVLLRDVGEVPTTTTALTAVCLACS